MGESILKSTYTDLHTKSNIGNRGNPNEYPGYLFTFKHS